MGRARSTAPSASPSSSPAPSTRRPPAARARSSSSLPEDMLRETAAVADAKPVPRSRPIPASPRWPSSRRCCGRRSGPSSSSAARAGARRRSPRIRRFAERFDLPVGCSFRRQMLFDHDHPNYAGDVGIGINPALADARQGGRRPPPRRRPHERDAVLRLHADRHSRAAADARPCPSRRRGARPRSIARRSPSTPARPPSPRRSKACSRRNAHRLERRDPRRQRRVPRLVDAGRESRPGPARRDRRSGSASACPTTPSSPTAPATIPAGCIASSASAATARSSRRPRAPWATACRRRSRPSCGIPSASSSAFAGDGCFQMTAQEFAHRRPVRRGGDRGASSTTASTAPSACTRSATIPAASSPPSSINPDFAALARAHGGHGETVARDRGFRPGLRARRRLRQAGDHRGEVRSAKRSPPPQRCPRSAGRRRR